MIFPTHLCVREFWPQITPCHLDLDVNEVKHIQTSTNMPMFYLATLKGQYSIYCCHFQRQSYTPIFKTAVRSS